MWSNPRDRCHACRYNCSAAMCARPRGHCRWWHTPLRGFHTTNAHGFQPNHHSCPCVYLNHRVKIDQSSNHSPHALQPHQNPLPWRFSRRVQRRRQSLAIRPPAPHAGQRKATSPLAYAHHPTGQHCPPRSTGCHCRHSKQGAAHDPHAKFVRKFSRLWHAPHP